VERIDYQHTLPQPTWNVALSTEQRIYISISACIFDANVHDLLADNRQRTRGDLFIRPGQVPVDPNG